MNTQQSAAAHRAIADLYDALPGLTDIQVEAWAPEWLHVSVSRTIGTEAEDRERFAQVASAVNAGPAHEKPWAANPYTANLVADGTWQDRTVTVHMLIPDRQRIGSDSTSAVGA